MEKIAVYEADEKDKRLMSKELSKHKLFFNKSKLDFTNLKKDTTVLSVMVWSKLDKQVLEKMPNLKMISTRGTGYDHIDLKYCRKKGIVVSNVPYYGENTVAEHTFALILSLSRHVHKSYVRTLNGDYTRKGLTGFDLKEKTIGIIGGGRIGLHVATMARAFGMHVRVFDVRQDSFIAEIINFKYVSMEELLKTADIVTLHVPLLDSTKHLMNKQTLSKMKKGSILVNTSRGGVVDTEALLGALKSGRLAGAGLDVIEGEELINDGSLEGEREKVSLVAKDKEILKMDNVVFTPHNAFNSKEALIRITKTTIENINSFLEGKALNVVRIEG